MSYWLSIYFMPVEPDPHLATFKSWNDAFSFFSSDRMVDWHNDGTLRESISTNWYYLGVVQDICKYYQECGLDFLKLEVAYLERADIELAQASLNTVIKETLAGFKDLPQHYQESGGICYLQHKCQADLLKKNRITTEQYAKMFEKILPDQRIEDDGIEGFICFLKALFSTFTECLQNGKHFLYIKPRP